MEAFVFYTAISSLLSAYVLLLMRKWGIIERVQVHGNDLFSEMFGCDFCLSWWTNVAMCLIFVIFTADAWLFLAPLCATPITRKLL